MTMGHHGGVTASLTRPQIPLRAWFAALFAAALVVAGLVTGAGPAAAHAALIGASPSKGSTISAVPPEVTLRFNEEIGKEFATVTVKGPEGQVSTGKAEVEGPRVYQAINPEMAEGKYTVAYRVVSKDGHAVSGSYNFTYGSQAGEGENDETPTATASPADPTATTSPGGTETTSPGGTATTSDGTATTGTQSPTASESTTASGDGTDGAAGESEQSESGGLSPAAWIGIAVAAVLVIAGIGMALAMRNRRRHDDELYDEDEDDGRFR